MAAVKSCPHSRLEGIAMRAGKVRHPGRWPAQRPAVSTVMVRVSTSLKRGLDPQIGALFLSIGARRAGFPEVRDDNNLGTLVRRRHFEQPQEPQQSPGIDMEVVSRQVCVPLFEPRSEQGHRRVDEMNLRSCPYSVRECDVTHPVIAKEEAIVKDYINGAPEKLRRHVPDQLSTSEHSSRVLFVTD